MSSGTTELDTDGDALDADSPETLPRDVLQNSLNALTDWAQQINERERGLDQERHDSSGRSGALRRPGLARHLGRHREDLGPCD